MRIIFPENSPLLAQQNPDLFARAHNNAAIARGRCLPDAFNDYFVGIDTAKTVAIIGGGPSLGQLDNQGLSHLQKLIAREDVIKVVAHSAHALLNDGRLNRADAVVCSLPAQGPEFIEPPRADVTYLLASHCDPSVAEKIMEAGITPYLWHPYEKSAALLPPDVVEIGAGSTAAMAALSLYAAAGCTSFEFYGVDSSVTYAYDAVGPGAEVLVTVGGRVWETTHNFWNQSREMKDFLAAHPDLKIVFHGGSLNAALFNHGGQAPFRVVAAQANGDAPAPRT